MLRLNELSYKNEIRLILKIFERPLNTLHDFLNSIEFQGVHKQFVLFYLNLVENLGFDEK